MEESACVCVCVGVKGLGGGTHTQKAHSGGRQKKRGWAGRGGVVKLLWQRAAVSTRRHCRRFTGSACVPVPAGGAPAEGNHQDCADRGNNKPQGTR